MHFSNTQRINPTSSAARPQPFVAAALFFLFLAATGPLVYKFAPIESIKQRVIALASISGVNGIGFVTCGVLAVRRALNRETKNEKTIPDRLNEEAIAKWVLDEVRSLNITSFNLVKPNEVRILTKEDLQGFSRNAAHYARRKVEIDTTSHSRFHEMRDMAVLSKQEHYGNCLSKSMVAFDTLICAYPEADTRFEIVFIRPGDHNFLVIGRDPKSEFTNFRTWGSKAYVVDCWSDAYYPASEILTNLYDFSSKDQGDISILQSKPFDPTKQSLGLYLSNLHGSDDVESLHPGQKQLLDEIHATADIREKKIKASALLSGLKQQVISGLEFDHARKSLQYQLEFLINPTKIHG